MAEGGEVPDDEMKDNDNGAIDNENESDVENDEAANPEIHFRAEYQIGISRLHPTLCDMKKCGSREAPSEEPERIGITIKLPVKAKIRAGSDGPPTPPSPPQDPATLARDQDRNEVLKFVVSRAHQNLCDEQDRVLHNGRPLRVHKPDPRAWIFETGDHDCPVPPPSEEHYWDMASHNRRLTAQEIYGHSVVRGQTKPKIYLFQTPPPEEAERLGMEYWERRLEAYVGWEAKQKEEEAKAKAVKEAKKAQAQANDYADADPEPTDAWPDLPNGLSKKKKKRRNGRGRRGGVRERERQERKAAAAVAVESGVPNENFNVRVSTSPILEMESVNAIVKPKTSARTKTKANAKSKVDDKNKNKENGEDKDKNKDEDKGQQTHAAGPLPSRPPRAENRNSREWQWKRPPPRTRSGPSPFDGTGFEHVPLDFEQGPPPRIQMEPQSTRPNSTLDVDAIRAAILAVAPPTGPQTAPIRQRQRQREPEPEGPRPRQGPREIPRPTFTRVPATAEAKGPAQSGGDNDNGLGIKAAAKPGEKTQVKEEKSPKPRNAGIGMEGGGQGKEAQTTTPVPVPPKEEVKEEIEIPGVNGPTPYQKFMNELFATLRKERNKKGGGGSGNGRGQGKKKE